MWWVECGIKDGVRRSTPTATDQSAASVHLHCAQLASRRSREMSWLVISSIFCLQTNAVAYVAHISCYLESFIQPIISANSCSSLICVSWRICLCVYSVWTRPDLSSRQQCRCTTQYRCVLCSVSLEGGARWVTTVSCMRCDRDR